MSKREPITELEKLRARIYELGKKKRTHGLTTREAAEYERINKRLQDEMGATGIA